MKPERFLAYQKKGTFAGRPAGNGPFTITSREFQKNKQGKRVLCRYNATDNHGADRKFVVETWRIEMVKELPPELRKELKAVSSAL